MTKRKILNGKFEEREGSISNDELVIMNEELVKMNKELRIEIRNRFEMGNIYKKRFLTAKNVLHGESSTKDAERER